MSDEGVQIVSGDGWHELPTDTTYLGQDENGDHHWLVSFGDEEE